MGLEVVRHMWEDSSSLEMDKWWVDNDNVQQSFCNVELYTDVKQACFTK